MQSISMQKAETAVKTKSVISACNIEVTPFRPCYKQRLKGIFASATCESCHRVNLSVRSFALSMVLIAEIRVLTPASLYEHKWIADTVQIQL